MLKFNEEKNLGKAVKPIGIFCWASTVSPIRDANDLIFAAGGNKFSTLCGLKFEVINQNSDKKDKKDNKDKNNIDNQQTNIDNTFEVSFCCKLRSHIYRAAPVNPSQWYIFRRIDDKTTYVLDRKTTLMMYNFDIDKFFESDLFKQVSGKFLKILTAGVPKLAKLYPQPDYRRYIRALQEALPLISRHNYQNKSFKLIKFEDLENLETK